MNFNIFTYGRFRLKQSIVKVSTPAPTPKPTKLTPAPTKLTPAPTKLTPAPTNLIPKLATNSPLQELFDFLQNDNTDYDFDLKEHQDILYFFKNNTITSDNWPEFEMSSGTKNIIYTGDDKNKPTIKAKGLTYPMFYYNGSDDMTLYIQNITLKFDDFTDSAFKIKVFDDAAGMLVLNSVDGIDRTPGYFNNFKNDSPIYIRADEGFCGCCGGANIYDGICNKKWYSFDDITGDYINTCICSRDGEPERSPLLAILNSNIEFKYNTIGQDKPASHGGAAIYVKNGNNIGNGAGMLYKNVNLKFIGNKTIISQDAANDFEGGGAVRTNFFLGEGKNNTLTFNNNSIETINGNDVRGGAVYVNDGWWCHQGEGNTTINAMKNKADKGSVGYIDQDSQGGLYFYDTCKGKVSSPNSNVYTFETSGGSYSCGNVDGCNHPT